MLVACSRCIVKSCIAIQNEKCVATCSAPTHFGCMLLQDADLSHPPEVTVLKDVEEQQPAAV